MSTEHPTDETLAVLAEGGLSAAELESVAEHVDTCDQCHAILQGDQDWLASEPPAKSNVLRAAGRFGSLLAAAAIAVAFLSPPLRERYLGFEPTGMRALIAASGKLKERPFEGRLSEDFKYRPAKDTMRGGGDKNHGEMAMKYTAQSVKADPKSDAHEKATAHLFLKEWDEAISTLENELKAEGPDPELLNDLAVAYLQSNDPARALAAVDRAWALEKSPRFLFNRALALQRMARYAAALAAWDEYLKLDPDSEWANDAREKRARIVDLSE